jgi:teichoic acid transport system permease protein
MTTAREYSDVEYVFEPHGSTKPDVRAYILALWDRRQFLVALAQSDLRSERSRTKLGNLWSVMDPLFQCAIYYFLFTVMRSGSPERLAFLPILIGTIFLFQLSMSAMGEAGGSIKRGKGLMLNSTFPRALLPLTSLFKTYRKFVFNGCVFAVLFMLFGGQLGPGLFLLPLFFALQIVMNIGIALLVATFVTLVADGSNVMNWISRLLFFATPVIYPVSLLPPGAKLLVGWQPLFPLFSAYQAILGGGMPSFGVTLMTVAWSFGLLFLGARLFLRHEREFTSHL